MHRRTVERMNGARQRVRQRGQAVVWLLATLAASAAIMLAVYSTTQVTVTQERTVNAADAAALAGATVEARMLNLVAYNNRAIMANEAFLIQMLSLQSWTQYVESAAGNLARAVRYIPYAQVAAPILQAISQMAGRAKEGLAGVADGVIGMCEMTKAVALNVHRVVLAVGSLAAEDAANSVLQASRNTFGGRSDTGAAMSSSAAVRGLTLARNAQVWNNFTRQYGGNQRTDARTVLLSSRDDFSATRPGASWMNVDLWIAGGEKNGGSRLMAANGNREGFDRWETQDTYELWLRGWRGKKNYIPIGWGRANADRSASKGTTMPPNRAAQSLARQNGGTHGKWTGVPSLYDIRDKTVAQRDQLEIPFAVVVERAQSSTLSAANLGMGASNPSVVGSPDMPERMAGNRYQATAKARVYFERPKRGLPNDFTAASLWRPDSAKEYGSLYSPYWQARLTDFTLPEKMALLAAMGITPDHALYTPGGQHP